MANLQQLSLLDLENIPQPKAKYLCTRPLKGTLEYKILQELEEYDRLMSRLPKELKEDYWYFEKVWDEGWWAWELKHYHTGLRTMPFRSYNDAIDQGYRLAAFYELLPASHLIRIGEDHPTWFTKLPTLVHWYQYDSDDCKRWFAEYTDRMSKI